MSLARLRLGEWLAAIAAIVLAGSMFVLHWYGGLHPRDGWQALSVLRWVVLATAAVVLLAVAAQLRRGPALSAALDVVSLVLASVTVILLAVRLATTGASLSWGAFVGLAGSIAMSVGVFAALRTEDGWQSGGARSIPVVAIAAGGEPSPD